MRGSYRLSSLVAAFVLGGVAAVSGPVTQAATLDNGGIGLQWGAGNHYQRFGLSWESPSLLSLKFLGDGNRLDLVGELGAAYWQASGSRTPASAWQFSAVPFLRWTIANRFYLEAGVGPTVFTRTQFAGETISTAFQFGDQIGVGAYLSNNSRLGVRYSHYSNGSIKTPNPGLNVLQLTYTYLY
ncbi:MAG: acyloxyacyl hydrolase [Candidimonas sp.]|nr:MAG: acyloxyacyl hydrolase [Candidimonas sp.]